MHVEPFPQPHERQKILPAGLLKLIARERVLQLVIELPELQVTEEIGLLVGELRVGRVSRLLLFEGPFARILNLQGRGDDQHLRQAALFARRQDHPPDPRIDRQTAQTSADLGQLLLLVDRAQLEERAIAVADGVGLGRIDEREIVQFAQPQGLHLQDHGGQVRPLDLRHGEAVAAQKICLAEKPHANTRPDAAATPLALLGRGLGHGLDGQPLGF